MPESITAKEYFEIARSRGALLYSFGLFGSGGFTYSVASALLTRQMTTLGLVTGLFAVGTVSAIHLSFQNLKNQNIRQSKNIVGNIKSNIEYMAKSLTMRGVVHGIMLETGLKLLERSIPPDLNLSHIASSWKTATIGVAAVGITACLGRTTRRRANELYELAHNQPGLR